MKGMSTFGPQQLRVVFDPTNTDTPCMVYLGRGSATFQCALAEGEVEGETLSRSQCDFLASLEGEADAFYDATRILT